MAERKKQPNQDMRAVSYRQFVQEQENIEWLLPDLMPNFGWTLFIGNEGSGKTTFCLQLCQALDEGGTFLGRKVPQTKTLYIQADSSPVEWREIIRLIAPTGIGFTIVNVPTGCMANDKYVKDLHYLINEKIQPGFIVLDSLYNLAGSSINSEHALTPIHTMRRLCDPDPLNPRPWLLIHHPPHDELRSAGSKAIPANASRVWFLVKNKLIIDKGRLTKIKEVRMFRSEETQGGLWTVEDTDNTNNARKSLREITKKYPSLGVSLT